MNDLELFFGYVILITTYIYLIIKAYKYFNAGVTIKRKFKFYAFAQIGFFFYSILFSCFVIFENNFLNNFGLAGYTTYLCSIGILPFTLLITLAGYYMEKSNVENE